MVPRLNTNLIRSMVQDLKEIDKLCAKIVMWVGEIRCVSWRYPTRDCGSVDVDCILADIAGYTGDTYVLILELIFDRMFYFFKLLVKFVNMVPIMRKDFDVKHPVCNVQHSFGVLLNVFWERISAIYDFLQEVQAEISLHQIQHGEHSSRDLENEFSPFCSESTNSSHCNTQTEEYSLINCESCHLSEELVKSLVISIESICMKYVLTSAISEERLHMQNAVFQITQWSAMQNWVQAILKDIKGLMEAMSETTMSNMTLNETMKEKESILEGKVKAETKKVQGLEDQIKQLQDKLQSKEQKMTEILREREAHDLQMTTVKKTLTECEKKLNDGEISRQQLMASNTKMKMELMKISSELGMNYEDNEELSHYFKTWKQQHEDTTGTLKTEIYEMKNKHEEVQKNIQHEFKSREIRIEEILEENNSLKTMILQREESSIYQLQEELNSSYAKIGSLNSYIKELQHELDKGKAREKLLLEYPDLNIPPKPNVHGDPKKDIEGQIEANKFRVQLLEEQTLKLQGTLNKLIHLSTKYPNI